MRTLPGNDLSGRPREAADSLLKPAASAPGQRTSDIAGFSRHSSGHLIG